MPPGAVVARSLAGRIADDRTPRREQTMASEFQRAKITNMFRAFDADDNGYLDQRDFHALAERWRRLPRVTPGSNSRCASMRSCWAGGTTSPPTWTRTATAGWTWTSSSPWSTGCPRCARSSPRPPRRSSTPSTRTVTDASRPPSTSGWSTRGTARRSGSATSSPTSIRTGTATSKPARVHRAVDPVLDQRRPGRTRQPLVRTRTRPPLTPTPYGRCPCGATRAAVEPGPGRPRGA